MLKCSNVMNPFLHVQHPAPLLARYKVITRPLESCSTELRHLPEPQPTAETHHPYKPPAAFSCSFHTALTTSRTRARGCSSQLNSPSVPQEGPHSRPCPNTSPSAGVPWAAAVSCHVCSVPLVGGTASALPWGTSCHTFALGFKPAPFDVTCWRDQNTLVSQSNPEKPQNSSQKIQVNLVIVSRVPHLKCLPSY